MFWIEQFAITMHSDYYWTHPCHSLIDYFAVLFTRIKRHTKGADTWCAEEFAGRGAGGATVRRRTSLNWRAAGLTNMFTFTA